MARIRSIKPEFGTNEQLASISLHARLTAALLPCHADKAGRLEDRPKRLKVLILPFDDVDMDRLLNELVKINFIQRYEIDGLRLIQITNFCKHQRPHFKEAESTLPSPELSVASTDLGAPSSVTVTDPDPIPDPVPEEGSGGKPDPQPTERESFDAFYAGYPRHKAREAAWKAWRSMNAKDRQSAFDDLPRARRLYAGREPEHIPYPSTYLNQKRWTDEEDLPLPRGAPTAPLNGGMANLMRIYEREERNGAGRSDQDSGEGQGELVPPADRRHNGG